jgi:hypothetical protein
MVCHIYIQAYLFSFGPSILFTTSTNLFEIVAGNGG